MELTLDLNSVDGVAIGIARGRMDMKDLEIAVTTLWDAVEGSDLLLLWDLRDARFDVESEDVHAFAKFVQSTAPPERLRTALVVSTDLEFGLSRMFEVARATENAMTEVFRDMDRALDWLRGPFL